MGRKILGQRSNRDGHVTAPKGGRHIPLTVRLANALRGHSHLRGRLILCKQDGGALQRSAVLSLVRRVTRRAQVQNSGVHLLRYTFCSHLAMRGAPARTIQELAGHADLSTTQRYMHLSPAAIDGAIRLLDQSLSGLVREILGETADLESLSEMRVKG